jgi:hypothetical protein
MSTNGKGNECFLGSSIEADIFYTNLSNFKKKKIISSITRMILLNQIDLLIQIFSSKGIPALISVIQDRLIVSIVRIEKIVVDVVVDVVVVVVAVLIEKIVVKQLLLLLCKIRQFSLLWLLLARLNELRY